MADWSYELNKNREKKIRSLARKLEVGSSTIDDRMDATDSRWDEIHTTSKKKSHANSFLLHLVAASVLFFITIIGARYPAAEEFIQTAWNQQMPYEKLTAWYQGIVGSRPTLLPVFPEQHTAETKSSQWTAPVRGKMVLSYTAHRKGVVIQTSGKLPVVAGNDGTVVFVGQKQGIGTTAVLRHADGKESWYGFLGKVTPKVGAQVKKGQQIGRVAERGGHYFVYLALLSNGQFIDPNGTIPFR